MIPSSAVSQDTLPKLAAIIKSSASAREGWSEVLRWVSARAEINVDSLSNFNLEAEIDQHRLKMPNQSKTGFLYFGLFEEKDHAGFYLSGGDRAPVSLRSLTNESLTNPKVYFQSKLLNELLHKSKKYPDVGSWFNYALTWAAAAIFAKELAKSEAIFVGFDSGDVESVS